MKVWSGSAWAEKPAKVWSGSAWVTKPVKVWTGSAWKTTGVAAPSGPTSKLLISFTPGPNRNDFSGEVGVRFGIAATATVSWIGMYVTTTGGTRKVRLMEWFADALVQLVTFDFTGKTVGTWVWMPITPVPMAAGSYYAVMHEVTAGDGLIWADALPPSVIAPDYGKVSNAYACYRTPGGGLTAYAENITYIGLDLGW